jgi:glycerol kinase
VGVVISIDAGTTSVRALAVDERGRPCGVRAREITQHFPRPGWVEHDAAEIWTTTQEVLGGLVDGLGPVTVAAIGIANQRETVVAWSRRTGEPLAPAIVWQDRRTSADCDALAAAGLEPVVRARTGLMLDPYFSATKLAWLVRHGGLDDVNDVAFGTVDAWLLWNLTGGRAAVGAVHATDASNASRTMLYDIRAGAWDTGLCELFSVDVRQMPRVTASIGTIARTTGGPGVPAGIAVSGVLGDQQAALFGQACLAPGMAKNTYGTGSFVLCNVGERCPEPVAGLLTTVAWQIDDTRTYAYEGAIFATGAAVQWLRDGLGIIASASELGPLAARCAGTDGVYFVPALAGLGSPWWDSHARGTIIGITRGTTSAHLARAAIEAMAFQTRDVVDTMTKAWGTPLRELRVDGGAAVLDLLLTTQADQLGVPVVRASTNESTALGAAFAAGIGAGVWTLDDVRAMWSAERTFAPDVARRAEADRAHAQWLRAVDRSRGWEQ